MMGELAPWVVSAIPPAIVSATPPLIGGGANGANFYIYGREGAVAPLGFVALCRNGANSETGDGASSVWTKALLTCRFY